MSNLLGMKRRAPREGVAESKVLHAWHIFRNRKRTKKTNPDGTVVITVSMSPGPTLKQWAKQEIKSAGPEADACKAWLEYKSGKLEKAAKAERFKNKGSLNAQIAAATKSARKARSSRKKGAAKQEVKKEK